MGVSLFPLQLRTYFWNEDMEIALVEVHVTQSVLPDELGSLGHPCPN